MLPASAGAKTNIGIISGYGSCGGDGKDGAAFCVLKNYCIFAFELMVARERGASKDGHIGGSNPSQFAKEVARPPYFICLYCFPFISAISTTPIDLAKLYVRPFLL